MATAYIVYVDWFYVYSYFTGLIVNGYPLAHFTTLFYGHDTLLVNIMITSRN